MKALTFILAYVAHETQVGGKPGWFQPCKKAAERPFTGASGEALGSEDAEKSDSEELLNYGVKY